MITAANRRCEIRGHLIATHGFTLIELVLVIAIIAVMAATAWPLFLDLSKEALKSVETGEVTAIRSGITLYGEESRVLGRAPIFPASLDNAASGASSSSNPLFSEVLAAGMTDGRWQKNSGLSYTSPSGNSYLYDSDDGTFAESSAFFYTITTGDGVSVSSSYGRLTGDYSGSALDIMIPNTMNGFDVKSIWQDVFNGRGLTSLAFEEDSQLERIHARAFRNNNLAEIDFPDGLKRIDLYAFDGNNLQEVVLPASLEFIEMNAFSNNDINKITIGSGVTIGNNAFENNDFRNAYSTGGEGTYLLIDGTWTKASGP